MSAPEIITFGCRLNAYETEVMRTQAVAAGLGPTMIFNTCAVTGEAVRQAAQAIRKARREHPAARIIVTGCAAQTEPERFAAMPEVDHVIGNQAKLEAATYRGLLAEDCERVRIDDIMSVRETAGHLIAGFGGKARAYVQIQNGCDHRCTFCIIPFGRGNSRSVPAGEVVAQVRRLVEAGTAEVVLTGVDITAYGRDLPGELSLGKLAEKVLRLVPELPRLRLSSIDSIEADVTLMRLLAGEERLMPHLHLSLQAGHDLTLKRMRRRHLRDDAIRFCAEARRLRPDVAFGADLIAGFPTETEEMFAATLDLVEACDLAYLHVFPYSARKGTPAARMPQVPRAEVKARAARLRAKASERLAGFLSGQVGRRLEVLVEEPGRGRTPQFAEIGLDLPGEPGRTVRAEVTGHAGQALVGRVLA